MCRVFYEREHCAALPPPSPTHGYGAVGGDGVGGLEDGHALPREAALLAPEGRRLERQQPRVCRHLFLFFIFHDAFVCWFVRSFQNILDFDPSHPRASKRSEAVRRVRCGCVWARSKRPGGGGGDSLTRKGQAGCARFFGCRSSFDPRT